VEKDDRGNAENLRKGLKMNRLKKTVLVLFVYLISLLSLTYFFQRQLFTNSIKEAVKQFFSTVFIELLVFCWFLLLICAIGHWIFSKIKYKFDSRLEELIFTVAIGFGFLSYSVFMLAVFRCLYFSVVFFILFALTIFLMPVIKQILTTIPKIKIDLNPFNLIFFIIIGQHIVSNFITALTPPVLCDELAYHLASAKIYIQNRGFSYIPYIPHSNWSSFMDMLYTLGLLFDINGIISKLFHFSTSIFCLLAIYAFAKKYFTPRVGILAAALFYTTFVVRQFAGSAFIDVALTFFEFLSVYAFLEWYYSEKRNWFILFSVFCGFSMAIKYTGIFLLFILTIGIFYKIIIVDRKKIVSLLKYLALFYSVSLVFLLPWLIKSYIYTGNPVFPFFYKIFGGINWDNYHAERFIDAAKSHAADFKGFINYLLLPAHLVFSGDRFWWKPQYFFAPFFIYLLLYLLIFRKVSDIVKYLLCYAFIYLFLFYNVGQETRFLLPIFPALSLVTASFIEKFYTDKRILMKLAAISILYPLTYRFPFTSKSHFQNLPVVLGLEKRKDYIQRNLDTGTDAMFQWMNENMADNTKTLLIGEVRGFYLDKPYVWGCSLNQAFINYQLYQSRPEFKNRLKETGITHIMINPATDFYIKIFAKDLHAQNLIGSVIKESALVHSCKEIKLYGLK